MSIHGFTGNLSTVRALSPVARRELKAAYARLADPSHKMPAWSPRSAEDLITLARERADSSFDAANGTTYYGTWEDGTPYEVCDRNSLSARVIRAEYELQRRFQTPLPVWEAEVHPIAPDRVRARKLALESINAEHERLIDLLGERDGWRDPANDDTDTMPGVDPATLDKGALAWVSRAVSKQPPPGGAPEFSRGPLAGERRELVAPRASERRAWGRQRRGASLQSAQQAARGRSTS